MKTIALFKSFLHWIKCGGDTVIKNSGPYQSKYLPVTKIYCDRCDKVFYERHR